MMMVVTKVENISDECVLLLSHTSNRHGQANISTPLSQIASSHSQPLPCLPIFLPFTIFLTVSLFPHKPQLAFLRGLFLQISLSAALLLSTSTHSQCRLGGSYQEL